MKEVNDFRFNQVRDYLKNSSVYSIENFMRKNGMLEHYKRRNFDSIIATCPFHEDKNPSFSLNVSEDIFRCFSCGAHGRFINFMHEYYLNKGEKVTIYDVAERILKGDPIMQESLGFKTIYHSASAKSENFTYDNFTVKKLFVFDKNKVPTSYKLIAKKLKKASIDEQVSFIFKMQHGESPNELL